jgi:hypothetical protein
MEGGFCFEYSYRYTRFRSSKDFLTFCCNEKTSPDEEEVQFYTIHSSFKHLLAGISTLLQVTVAAGSQDQIPPPALDKEICSCVVRMFIIITESK